MHVYFELLTITDEKPMLINRFTNNNDLRQQMYADAFSS